MHLLPSQMHLSQARQQLRSHWRLLAIKFVPYGFVLLVLFLPQVFQLSSKSPVVDLMSTELSVSKDGPWQHFDLSSLLLPHDVGWLKVKFDVPESIAERHDPLGLYLSGTFSASAFWNGQAVGGKGKPGGTRLFEQPGPIDDVIYLPGENIQAGENLLLMEVSSFYRPFEITTIIHGQDSISGLRVGPYSADPRRPIGYYSAPFVVSGLLILSFFLLLFRSDGARSVALLLTASLAIAAIVEVSRSFINYEYAYHGLRLWTVTFLTVFFAQILLVFVMRIQPHQYSCRLTSISLGATLLLGYGLSDSFLLSPPQVIGVSALMGLGYLVHSAGTDEVNWELMFALAVFPLVILVDQNDFMDRGLYAACLPLIALLVGTSGQSQPTQDSAKFDEAFQQKDLQQKTLQPEAIQKDRLIVKSVGKEKIVPYSAIRMIQGAGNYAEIKLSGNESLLDDRSLNQLEAGLPDCFFRVHRSYIVNLEFVIAVQSLGAGKYRIELSDGEHLPVSRNKISALRDQI